MSSRKQAENKPYWKRRQKQQAAYYRQYAFDEQGNKVLDDKGEQIFRDVPNRALKRRIYAGMRK